MQSAVLKSSPEDFFVREILNQTPEGAGEHLWATVRKTGQNTHDIAKALARWAGQPVSAIGYAGLKDKFAVTIQTFSIPGNRLVSAEALSAETGLEVLQAQQHGTKIRKGELAGNYFEIILREVKADKEVLDSRMTELSERGFPNYFGLQRFGRDGNNLQQARLLFKKRIRPNKFLRGMYLSAARSYLFNDTLSRRVISGCWDVILPGDILVESGCPGHPTPSGPLWGQGDPDTTEVALEYESHLTDQFPLFTNGLKRAGLRQDRRSLVGVPSELAWEWADGETLRLTFSLSAGGYATALLAELGDVTHSTVPRGG